MTLADNGFIVDSDGTKTVFEQKYKDDIPQKMLEEILAEMIDCIINGGAMEFDVRIEVEPKIEQEQ